MKKKSAIILIMIFGAMIALSSCATKKQYGCPEHISISNIFSLIK